MRVHGSTYYQQVPASSSIGALKAQLLTQHAASTAQASEAMLCYEGRPLPDDMLCSELKPNTLLELSHRQRGGAPGAAVSDGTCSDCMCTDVLIACLPMI